MGDKKQRGGVKPGGRKRRELFFCRITGQEQKKAPLRRVRLALQPEKG